MAGLRINARLDEESAADLKFLRSALGDKSITDVLKFSLPQVADDMRERNRAKRQKHIWRESGFIGEHAGPEDLSTNYKRYLADVLDAKYAAEK